MLCLVPGGIADAGDPASVLPEGVFATGEGCTMLAQSGTDEIDVMDFLVLTNGELTGMDFACKFTDAEAGTTDNHNSYAVKATCESGAPGVPAVITIKEMSDGELHLTMKSEGDVDDLDPAEVGREGAGGDIQTPDETAAPEAGADDDSLNTYFRCDNVKP